MPPGRLKRADHGGRDVGVGQKIAACGAIGALRLPPEAKNLSAGVDGRRPGLAYHQKLAVSDMGAAICDRGEGIGRGQALGQPVKDQRAKGGVGDVLAGHGPDPRPHMGAAGGDGGGRRGDGHAELPGGSTARDDGEGHAGSSGITAVPSISTSHEGRASAVTTTPVETGCTSLM